MAELALSVQQPWAWLLTHGRKNVENRSWPTNHRGRLWVHAGQQLDEEGWLELVRRGMALPPSAGKLHRHDLGDRRVLPSGALVGAVDLIGCVRDSTSPWAVPGQWHWLVAQSWVLPEPVPMRGHLGLWPVPIVDPALLEAHHG